MFRQRLLTTVVLVPLVFAVIFYSPRGLISMLLLLMVLGCGYEWLRLIPLIDSKKKIIFLMGLILSYFMMGYVYLIALVIGLFVWLSMIFFITQYPKQQQIWANSRTITGIGLLLLPLFAQSLMNILMQPQGKKLLVHLLLLVWSADIGAYLFGKQWGKQKVIPNVSPGKTVEGMIGGFILTLFVSVAMSFFIPVGTHQQHFILAIAVVIFAILGDLFISMLKRRVQIKDCGTLIPGHGGLLDRLDSLIAVAPIFYIGWYLLFIRL